MSTFAAPDAYESDRAKWLPYLGQHGQLTILTLTSGIKLSVEISRPAQWWLKSASFTAWVIGTAEKISLNVADIDRAHLFAVSTIAEQREAAQRNREALQALASMQAEAAE